ncbi:LytR C-terminal domain-containing protein [Bifidobacterium callimiconis]|uniref:Cell wall integrity and stress response protein 1 n=1 Tax=Bifidobacterium callimiconis TaxID=2306973 RepID=A0A430FGD6_9BIFI|nr:LytR C-terminal domain-containing protein [Bifidobacterium callimiconis]MBT1176611.1 LytR C-terminal domain-containing protein [Bifidobacterium callimiconis]RSX51933.1 cell wall integrity and stress response protein 1 [Bifidobacterium callimiconis]
MSDKQHVYPADEFDKPGQGPVGLHRGPRSFGARALPYLIVIIVAALCGLGVFMWLSGTDLLSGTKSASSASTSVTKSADTSSSATESESASPSETSGETAGEETPSESASPSESATASESPSESASSAATVDHSSTVIVYNGTSTSGLASKRAATLTNAGYTSVSAKNPNNRSTLPSTSTVWYRDESDLATAQDVAAQLGISQIVQSQSIDTQIAVVLMQ